jgi:hypothetical protein
MREPLDGAHSNTRKRPSIRLLAFVQYKKAPCWTRIAYRWPLFTPSHSNMGWCYFKGKIQINVNFSKETTLTQPANRFFRSLPQPANQENFDFIQHTTHKCNSREWKFARSTDVSFWCVARHEPSKLCQNYPTLMKSASADRSRLSRWSDSK